MSDSSLPSSQQKPKGKFTADEDAKLMSLVDSKFDVDWSSISSQMGNKTSRQCRERWQNYLDPRLTKNPWTSEEDTAILAKYNELGPHWNAIARTLRGRSGNCIRNRYMKLIRLQEKKEKIKLEHQSKSPSIFNVKVQLEKIGSENRTNVKESSLPNIQFVDNFSLCDIFDSEILDAVLQGFDGKSDAFASFFD